MLNSSEAIEERMAMTEVGNSSFVVLRFGLAFCEEGHALGSMPRCPSPATSVQELVLVNLHLPLAGMPQPRSQDREQDRVFFCEAIADKDCPLHLEACLVGDCRPVAYQEEIR